MSSFLRGAKTYLLGAAVIALVFLEGCFFGNSPRLPVTSALVDLTGEVIDAQTRKGVSGAQIVVKDYPSRADLTASDGSFFIPRVPAGRQVLLVSVTGYATRSQAIDIPEVPVFRVTVELSPFLGKITGFVWDAEGKPVAGATITVDGQYTAVTQADGSFVLASLPVGTFAITVEKEGFVPYAGEVEIQAASITVVKVVLESQHLKKGNDKIGKKKSGRMIILVEGFDLNRYVGVFLEEVEEHIENLEENLVQLEREPDNQDLVQSIFRSFHTIKGSSSSMGFQRMMELSHLMENLLDGVRSKSIAVTPSLVDVLLRGVDLLKNMKDTVALEGKEPEVDIQHITENLKVFLKRGEEAKVAPETTAPIERKEPEEKEVIAPASRKEYLIRVYLTLECSMKGVRSYLVINRLQENKVEVISTNPPLADLESERFGQSFEIVAKATLPEEEIRKMVESVAEVEKVEIEVQEELPEEKVEVKEEEEKEIVSTAGQKKAAKSLKKTVRVDVERLDALLNLVGELVIDRARLGDTIQRLRDFKELSHFRDLLSDTNTHIGRIINELQMEIMKARMLPLAEVFNRFPRMVRDIARNSGKEVDFVVQGEETELDRSLLEEITDPLIHLLRNAVDHGIELREERIAQGKPPRGRVLLKAYQEENSVVIMVQDDGRGLDTGKIRNKALRLGLASQEELEKMSDREVMEFIFYPGFSTNDQVTDVSGRGVGMDIVRRNMERVNGQVRIESEAGKGTTFYLRLPLTLAIIRALLVQVDGGIYSIPLADVVEIEKVKRENTYWVNKTLTALFRGKVLTLLRLKDLLQSKKAEYFEGEETPEVLYTVVVNAARAMAGLVVDEIIGEQEIVIKSLGSYIGDVRGLSGATILGDGRVSLIVDVPSLLWKNFQMGG